MTRRALVALLPAAGLLAGLGAIAVGVAAAPSLSDAASAGSGFAPLSWTRIETAGKSGLTYESACAYDSRAHRLVMFGGHGFAYAGTERHDTWLLDTDTMAWTKAAPANRPPGACCTRDLLYDAAQNVSYFFGGCMYFHGWQWKAPRIRGGSPPWAYDAARDTWIPMKPGGPAPARVAYAGMAFDRDDEVVVKFGGGGCKVEGGNSTWIYDGYANTWTERNPIPSPPGGRLPAMTYDERHHTVLLFGAHDGKSNDLWSYDIRANTWTNRAATASPPAGEIPNAKWGGPVDYGIFVYDRATGTPILFRPRGDLMGAWSYDWESNAWRLLAATNPPPGAALVQGAFVPDRGLTLLVNGGTPDGKGYLNGTWAFAHERSPEPAALPPPTGLVVTSSRARADLSWTPAAVDHYAIYRGIGDHPWEVVYEKIGETKKTSFSDRHLKRKGKAFYMVRSANAGGEEGRDSMKARTEPRAPREPVVSVVAGDRIEIDWIAGTEADIAGYNLYRGRGKAGFVEAVLIDGTADGFERVNASLIEGTRFVDTVATAEGLAYHVSAVNRREIESGPSPWALSVPGEVRGIAVGEEAGSPVLTWRSAPEKGIRGYNVYRLDSIHQESAKKLNGDPVTEPRYADASKKDRSPCKYYVASVDSRGVEGVMSFGAWAYDDGLE